MAITSFRHKGLEELFESGRSAKIGQRYHTAVILILDHLDAVTDLQDCVGVRNFHGLTGDRDGTYAMNVSGNYRVTFKWAEGDVTDVDFEDYH